MRRGSGRAVPEDFAVGEFVGDGRALSVAAETPDYMDYLADMILELQAMADHSEAPTLAGILALAHREALIQKDARTRR